MDMFMDTTNVHRETKRACVKGCADEAQNGYLWCVAGYGRPRDGVSTYSAVNPILRYFGKRNPTSVERAYIVARLDVVHTQRNECHHHAWILAATQPVL